MNKIKEQFQQALLETVDEGLLTLGESGRKAVYFHLQNSHSLQKEDIPNKPEIFAEGLRKIFGFGAEMIEKTIVKKFYFKLGITYEEKKNYTFMDYLNDANV